MLVFLLFSTYAQKKQVYTIYKNNDIIGELSAILTQTQNSYNICIHSNSKVNVLVVLRIQVLHEDSFSNGKLVRSKVINKVNGFEKFNNLLLWKDGLYSAYEDDHFKKTIQQPIAFSTASILFFEPATTNCVYAPNFLQMAVIKKMAANSYMLTFPDGNINYYTYENGVCTKVIINTNYSTVQLILKQQ